MDFVHGSGGGNFKRKANDGEIAATIHAHKRMAFAAGATPFKGTREFGRPIQNDGSPFGQYTQQQQQPQYQVQQPQQLGQNHQLHQEQHGQQHQLGGWEYSGQQLWCRPDDGAAEQAISMDAREDLSVTSTVMPGVVSGYTEAESIDDVVARRDWEQRLSHMTEDALDKLMYGQDGHDVMW